MTIESEKLLERKLYNGIKKLGGISIKLASLHFIGLPDRLCLLPVGHLFFAEIKTTKMKPRKIQLHVHKKLRDIGFIVEIIDTSEQIIEILNRYERKPL